MIRLIINEIVKCGRVKILTSYFVFTFVTFFIYILNENIIEYSYLNSYIMFIGIYASMLFGGIISNEVEKGTIRFYLSKPVKRWKIYLAKLLTIILYILSVMLLLIIIYNLLTREFDTKSILMFLKNCIPLLIHSVLILLFSTCFRSTSLCVGLYIFLIMFGVSIFQLLLSYDIDFILYTFIPYLDFSIFNDLSYLDINEVFNVFISIRNGIIIDVVYFLILYFIGNFIFIKKDISN